MCEKERASLDLSWLGTAAKTGSDNRRQPSWRAASREPLPPSLRFPVQAGGAQAKPRGRAVPENMLAGVHGAESWGRRDPCRQCPRGPQRVSWRLQLRTHQPRSGQEASEAEAEPP